MQAEAVRRPVAPSAVAVNALPPGRHALRRFRRDRVGMAALVTTLAIALVALFAPVVTGLLGVSTDPDSQLISDNGGLPISGATLAHPLGVEPGTGRDVLALLLAGARVTLLVAVLATIVTVATGVVVGTLAAVMGGPVDRLVSWAMDLALTFPQLLLLLALSGVLLQRLTAAGIPEGNPSRITYLTLFFAVFGWPYVARLVRGQVIGLRERDFVQAAVLMGASRRRIVFTELLPNLWGPVIVYATIGFPQFIAFEATLAFLNVGVDASTPAWGLLLLDSAGYLQTYPIYLIGPAGALVLTVLAVNLLGDAIRDALDPRGDRRW